MPPSAPVRLLSAEEIAAQAGGETPRFQWPEPSTLFAERQMRLQQLAPQHPMEDFLRFMAELARAQQAALAACPSVPLPDQSALDRAARAGLPPLPAVDWPRDAAWRPLLRALAKDLRSAAPEGVRAAIDQIDAASDDWLERQADCLLTGVMQGLNLATAPIIAAALQVLWTHMVLQLRRHHDGGPLRPPFGRIDDPGACPCCGSRPTASITLQAAGVSGQRYLHCSLCNTQWYLERIKCAHCASDKSIAYQALDRALAPGDSAARAASSAVQAETCDDCGHYLKIMHRERDPFCDPVADDLASLTLDLLVSETGKQRHGVNLMLLFGEPGPPGADAV